MLSSILQVPEVKEVLLSSRYFNVISDVIRSELLKQCVHVSPFMMDVQATHTA